MRQLLIAKSIKAAGTKMDTSGYVPANGELAVYGLSSYETIASAPTENFAIALGRPNGQMPFTISEVDLKSLSVNVAKPSISTPFKFKFSIVNPTANTDYTIRLFKKGVVPHERNSWTIQFRTNDKTAESSEYIAGKLRSQIKANISDKFDIVENGSEDSISLTANSAWQVMLVDGLRNVTPTINQEFKPAIGDKAYVQDLASKCAAGKGFTDTYAMGPITIPGYPETVEDGSYTIYTLRFKVGRDSAKTRDERVWQVVHIATSDTTTATALNTIFTNNIEDSTIDEPSED